MEGEKLAEYQRMKKENEELQKQMSMMKRQLAELKGKTTQEDHPVLEGQDMTVDSIGMGQAGSAEPNQINPNQSNFPLVVRTQFVPKPPTDTSYLLNRVNFRSRKVKSGKKAKTKKDQIGVQSGIEAPLVSSGGQQFDHSGPYNPYPPYYPYPPLPPTSSYVNQNPCPYQSVPQPSFQSHECPRESRKRPVCSLGSEPTIPRDQQKGYMSHQDRFQFAQIPMTYTELLHQLIQQGLMESVYVEPMQPPYPMWYDPNVQCEYHMNVQGHSTEDCTSLKKRVQTLIKAGLLSF